jgi:hypothetical protein
VNTFTIEGELCILLALRGTNGPTKTRRLIALRRVQERVQHSNATFVAFMYLYAFTKKLMYFPDTATLVMELLVTKGMIAPTPHKL